MRAGGRGGLGGIPPALQILGEICSNFFERTPPKAKAFWRTGPPVSVRYKNEAIDKIVNYPGAYFWLRLCDDGQTGGKEELGVGV